MTEPLPPFGLGEPGPMRDRLVDAVLAGQKIATSSLLVFYQLDGLSLPRPGELFRLVDTAGETQNTIEITHVDVVPFAKVGDDLALAEGEGFTGADDWRAAHLAFWDRYRDQVREFLGDPVWEIRDDTDVVVEYFRLA